MSTSVIDKGNGKATVKGNFTFMGVTKPIEIEASMVGMGKDPWGGFRAGFEGTTLLKTKEFGLSLPPTDEVELALYIEGIKQ